MAYRIAGIDIHKKMIAVAIADVEVADTWEFERRQLGTTPNQLRALAEWLVAREVDEVVMNRPRSIGGRCGRRWSVGGNHGSGRRDGRVPARGIWRKRSRTRGDAAGSEITPTPSDW